MISYIKHLQNVTNGASIERRTVWKIAASLQKEFATHPSYDKDYRSIFDEACSELRRNLIKADPLTDKTPPLDPESFWGMAAVADLKLAVDQTNMEDIFRNAQIVFEQTYKEFEKLHPDDEFLKPKPNQSAK